MGRVRVDQRALERFVAACCIKVGMPTDDARLAAAILTRSTARGSETHGVNRLPSYLAWIESGGVNPCPRIESRQATAVVAMVSGDGGLGHVVASRAVDLGVEMAREYGVGLVGVTGSSHLGAVGSFALKGAEAGLVTLAFSTTPLVMQAGQTLGRGMGNGPMAYGIPRPEGPIVFDIAMSASSGGRVQEYAARGEALPEGWVVDDDGRPSTDPQAFLRGGALVAIAGHKGFGLTVMVEILSGVLTGATLPANIPVLEPDVRVPPDIGHLFILLDPVALAPDFPARIEEYVASLAALSPTPGAEPLRLPGERANALEMEAGQRGISLPEPDVCSLLELADRLGLVDELPSSLAELGR